MSDAEKKQAWYIANAQGYCLEFRLSENKVNSYDTYCTERDNYKTGANPGGGWLPLCDWLPGGCNGSYGNGELQQALCTAVTNQELFGKAEGTYGLHFTHALEGEFCYFYQKCSTYPRGNVKLTHHHIEGTAQDKIQWWCKNRNDVKILLVRPL